MIKCFVIMFKNKKLFFLFCFNLSIIIFVFSSVNIAFAAVDRIVFINEPQTIKVGEFSNQYQIQLQDETGLITTSSDTTYFTLPLDIGSFYSKTDGQPFTASSSIYIATGSSNKYFYFKSDQVGEYLIKVYARNKDNTKQWETEQIVKVVSEITENTNTESENNTNTTNSVPQVKVITRTVYVSAHSGEEDLSNFNEENFFKISAGRERMALVGSPLQFDAKYNLTNNYNCSPSFRWSFGDGFDTEGKNISHIYKYSGEYQVVLNGVCGEYNSVSRTVAKVMIPSISVTKMTNGDTEIMNNGKTEINIGEWKMKTTQKEFNFSKDTIISTNNKIIISKEDFNNGSSTEKIFLMNPEGREVALVDNSKKIVDVPANAFSQNSSSTKIIAIQKDIVVPKIETKTTSIEQNKITENIPEEAAVSTAINSETRGFWAKLIDIPVNGVKSFAHLFYNF